MVGYSHYRDVPHTPSDEGWVPGVERGFATDETTVYTVSVDGRGTLETGGRGLVGGVMMVGYSEL